MNYPLQRQPYNPFNLIWIILAILIFLLTGVINRVRAEEIYLTASWYSLQSLKDEGTYKLTKGRCADGSMFKDEGYSCAVYGYKFGTILKVTNIKTSASVQVVVKDRIGKRFKGRRIDLSKFAFQKICDLDKGLCKVKVEVLR